VAPATRQAAELSRRGRGRLRVGWTAPRAELLLQIQGAGMVWAAAAGVGKGRLGRGCAASRCP